MSVSNRSWNCFLFLFVEKDKNFSERGIAKKLSSKMDNKISVSRERFASHSCKRKKERSCFSINLMIKLVN